MSSPNCFTCKYVNTAEYHMPCLLCYKDTFPMYEPLYTDAKTCFNCKHNKTSMLDEPCCLCIVRKCPEEKKYWTVIGEDNDS